MAKAKIGTAYSVKRRTTGGTYNTLRREQKEYDRSQVRNDQAFIRSAQITAASKMKPVSTKKKTGRGAFGEYVRTGKVR